MTKDQDVESSAHAEVPGDMDEEAITHPEVAEYHEVPLAVSRDEGNINNTPKYVRTMDLDVAKIDKNDKIHRVPSTRQLMHLTW